MSEHHHVQRSNSLNANLAAAIFVLTFVIIAGVIYANAPQEDAGDTVEVALAEPTVTAVPADPTMPPTPTATLPPTNTPAPTATPTEPPLPTSTQQTTGDTGSSSAGGAGDSAASYDPALVEQGESLFLLCSACHGADARGLPNLGKDLVASEFVAGLTDDELVQFITTGRPIWDPLNTTGIDMPPRGGNPAMTNEDIQAIVAYLRTISAQSGGTTVAEPADDVALAYDPALIARGESQFLLCSACHGADARGLPNLGKDLVASEFVHSMSDEDLLTFVKTGRPIWDPLNTTGIDMPPRGGNPAMTDDDILAIIAYLRSLAAGG